MNDAFKTLEGGDITHIYHMDGRVVDMSEVPHVYNPNSAKYTTQNIYYNELTGKYTLIGPTTVYFKDTQRVGEFDGFTHIILMEDLEEIVYNCYENPEDLKDFKSLTDTGFSVFAHSTFENLFMRNEDADKLESSTVEAFYEDISYYRNYSDVEATTLLRNLVRACKQNMNNVYKIKDYEPHIIDKVRTVATAAVKEIPDPVDVESFQTFVSGYTIGLEYEAVKSNVYPWNCAKLGILPLKDGSLGSYGKEYATLPFHGVDALKMNYQICTTLAGKLQMDLRCALHVHIGGIRRDPATLLALYTLYYRIQDELMELMPYYLRDQVSIGQKNQNYCEPIISLEIGRKEVSEQTIKIWYDRLKNYYTGQSKEDKDVKVGWGERSWNSPTRYVQLNMLNLFEKGSSDTVEFRLHPPTLDSQRVIAWILLCSAICKFAENNVDYILSSKLNKTKITLDDVLNSANLGFNMQGTVNNNSVSHLLVDYVNDLREHRINESMEVIMNASTNGGGLRTRNTMYRRMAKKEIAEDKLPFDFTIFVLENNKDEVQSKENEEKGQTAPV